MKILLFIFLPFWTLIKYIGECFLIVGLFCLIISSPLLPMAIAADTENPYWLLLYIPVAFFWGVHLMSEEK